MTVLLALFLTIGLFAALIVCLDVGYRLGRRRLASGAGHDGAGAIEAAVFALLGLLLGFSFSGAEGRLDHRRHLVVEEANAIGTAYLRLDILPAAEQPPLRAHFREYLDSRLRLYANLSDPQVRETELARTAQIQQAIWSKTILAGRNDPNQSISRLLIPALNGMIDVTTTRTVALDINIPKLIVALLFSVALLSALVAGFAMAKSVRSWFHMIVYALVITVTVYVVIDLDHPRSGLIRVDAADNAMAALRDSIQKEPRP